MGFHMSGAPLYLRRFRAQGAGLKSGSDCVFTKNQSEPDLRPGLPVRPTKRESIGPRPQPGLATLFIFYVFLETPLAVGSEQRRPGRKPGLSSLFLGICCTKLIY